VAQALEVGFGDHAAVRDDDQRRQREALLELVDLAGQHLVVMERALEHLDRDRAAIGRQSSP
jgi:hypothetical protein